MTINDGGPAFPQAFTAVATGEHVDLTVPHPGDYSTGMTLLDYFAAKALPSAMNAQVEIAKSGQDIYLSAASSAKAAYELADAMIAERNKT